MGFWGDFSKGQSTKRETFFQRRLHVSKYNAINNIEDLFSRVQIFTRSLLPTLYSHDRLQYHLSCTHPSFWRQSSPATQYLTVLIFSSYVPNFHIYYCWLARAVPHFLLLAPLLYTFLHFAALHSFSSSNLKAELASVALTSCLQLKFYKHDP